MSREWKPGDVAMVVCGDERERRATYRETAFRGPGWHFADGAIRDVDISEARPLVVIDPEDREQVERLGLAVAAAVSEVLALDDEDRRLIREATPDALREFANPTPPKPDEPTGLGAVVEDAEGKRFIRYGASLAPWIGHAENEDHDPDRPYRYWSGIEAVRVLSEGVTS